MIIIIIIIVWWVKVRGENFLRGTSWGGNCPGVIDQGTIVIEPRYRWYVTKKIEIRIFKTCKNNSLYLISWKDIDLDNVQWCFSEVIETKPF